MQKKVLKDVIISIMLSVFLSISYDASIDKIEMKNMAYSRDIIWLIIAIGFFLIIQYYRKNIKVNKRLNRITSIVSSIISSLFTTGQIFNDFILYGININEKLMLFTIIKFLLYTIISKYLITIAYYSIENWQEPKESRKNTIEIFTYNRKNFLILTAIIFIAYLPWFLNYYPGICSLDSLSQMLQVIGSKPMTSHHPIIHTAIIGICLKIGNLINDYNTGVAIYSIIQMLFCAMTFSYVVLYLNKKKVSKQIQLFLLLFFMFCPIVCNYSVTMWKDIPFALTILITTTYLIDLFTEKSFNDNIKNYILLSLFLLLDCLFRKNGFYCIILLFVIILFIKTTNKKKILLSIIIPIILTVLITGPLYSMLDIAQGDTKEAYSVFMQQFAAVRKYNSHELSKKEQKEIDNFFENRTYIDLYNPIFADPVKRVFSEQYVRNNKTKMIKLYIKNLFKYPKTTIKSFISGNYGYYYPNIVGWEVYNRIDSKPPLNIKRTPIIKIPLVEKLNLLLNSHDIPIVGVFCSCGLYAFLLIFVIGYFIYKRQERLLISTIPVIGVELTAMLSPVFCERRYVYSIYLVATFLLALCFSNSMTKSKIKR